MASNAGIFFAGVGTTFIILGAGFGGGVMMANSALDKPAEYQTRASVEEAQSPARVILPSSAEATQPPQQPQQIAAAPQPLPQIQPVKETQPLGEKQASKMDTKKADAERRERRKRYAERKAKRQERAEKAKRQQQLEPIDYQEAPVMAFGGDEQRDFGYFGD